MVLLDNLSSLFWRLIPLLFLTIFLLPIIFVLLSLFGNFNENWDHLINYVLPTYVLNSIILVLGVSAISLVLGVGTAWLVTNYKFFCQSWLEWAIILPLAIPPYILAYTFTGLFDSYGSANLIIKSIFSLSNDYVFFPNVRNLYGAITVFAFTLYPLHLSYFQNGFLKSVKKSDGGRQNTWFR